MPETVESCPPGRCARCNEPGGHHKLWCKRHPQNLSHEAVQAQAVRPATSAERLKDVELPGRADADIAPTQPGIERYSRANLEGRVDHIEPRFAGRPFSEVCALIQADDARKAVQEAAVVLPADAAARKDLPLASGLLDYFPAALLAVAGLSRIGNEQHNPGQPLHWARGKSGDEADALLRHLVDRGTVDTDGVRHSTKVAWRALALLQKELETAGEAPLSRGSREG